MSEPLRRGDTVRIRPAWRDGADDTASYVVVEWNGDRGFISPTDWPYAIVPQDLVTTEMIEPATRD